MISYVLDTNIVAAILKGDPRIVTKLRHELVSNVFIACPMVWHETRRGLLAKDARKQQRAFEDLFAQFIWQEYQRADWSLAAELWSKRRALGRPINDADLLIAVFAINRNAILVTDNTKDFSGLDAHLENWR